MVLPKKSLGQHFLNDHNIARKIVSSLPPSPQLLLEIGPGTGILTGLILQNEQFHPVFIETDGQAVAHLRHAYPDITGRLIHGDFLKADLKAIIHDHYQVVGNLPYNISSQIFFRFLEDRRRLQSAVVMIQKEVADRIRSAPGSKVYGILSVLLQTWYKVEYLFGVSQHVFRPPPKVMSAVVRLSRNNVTDIGCSDDHYFGVVKAAFNQRRKTLRNALKPYLSGKDIPGIAGLLDLRAEQLSVEDFIELASQLE
jgi:16S rRNA (adenine1518-N6/adenine1519-N6)-dimethyltransferase